MCGLDRNRGTPKEKINLPVAKRCGNPFFFGLEKKTVVFGKTALLFAKLGGTKCNNIYYYNYYMLKVMGMGSKSKQLFGWSGRNNGSAMQRNYKDMEKQVPAS